MIEVRIEVRHSPATRALVQLRPRDDATAHGIPPSTGTVASFGEPEVAMGGDRKSIRVEENRCALALLGAVIASRADPSEVRQSFVQIADHRGGRFLETGDVEVIAAQNA